MADDTTPDGTCIEITRKGNKVQFAQVEITKSQLVFWKNSDPDQPHWPIQGPRFQTGPGNTSDNLAPYPAPVPTTIYYGCAIPGHESERGSIVVYDDFLPSQVKNSVLPAGKVNTAYAAQSLATGGKSPYTSAITFGALPDGLTAAPAATANTGINLSGTPTKAGTFIFTFTASDSLQNTVEQTFTITIS